MQNRVDTVTITESISAITDEIIAMSVTFTAIACAGYIVYTTGEVPAYLSMGFGAVLTYYYTKSKATTA